MSKFIFLLCAFLCVGAVWADDAATQTEEEVTPSYVQDIKNKLIDSINGAIKGINDKVQDAQIKTSEYAQKLKEEALKVAQSVYDKIVAAQKNVKSEVEKVISEAVNVNVTECVNLTEAFDQASLQVLAETSHCVVDIIEDADGYIASIIHTSNIVLKNLTSIRDEAELCVKDIDGIKTATKAFYCVNVAAAKGTWAATKKVPSLFADIGKLTFKISTLLPELTVCSTVKGVQNVDKNSSEIVQKVKECVAARKAAAGDKKNE